MKIISIFLTFLVLCMITVLVPSNAYACSCAGRQTVDAQFSHSDAVFAGRVIEVKEQSYFMGSTTKAALFEVSRIWKGGTESEIIIHTGLGGGDCGINFEVGKEYLVYARPSAMYGEKELLVTIICDRTNVLDQAQEDLNVLGEFKVPTKHVNLKGDLDTVHPYLWAALIGIAVIGIAIIFVWKKRKVNS